MKYRKLGNTGIEVSALGFGCMRLPNSNGKIREQEVREMVHYAIDHGINYFDNAYPYHDGQSEAVLGNVLEPGLRNRVYLATKMPCWLIESYDDFDKYLDIQLRRLKTDHIDFYLLHAVFNARWHKMLSMDAITWLEKAKQKGKINYFGFSFHDNVTVFKKIIDTYKDWDICQVQYNYVGQDFQAGREGIKYSYKNGIPVAVMEPLLGGLLAPPAPGIAEMLSKAGMDPIDIALQWLWDQQEVSFVLSGMSSLEHVKANIRSADKSGIRSLSEKQHSLIEQACRLYEELNPIPCTKCGYCMPCPHGVDIPSNFELYRALKMYGNIQLNQNLYTWHLDDERKAKNCTECRECESKCPQEIKISRWMKKIHTALNIAS